MKAIEKARMNAFVRTVQFAADFAGDFVAGSIAAAQIAIITAVIATVNELSGKQAAGLGDARYEFGGKDTARENLHQTLTMMAKTARLMAYEFPNIERKFVLPVNQSDANMLAVARAFLQEAAAYKDDFIRYEADENFMTDLENEIEAFEQALSAPGTAIDSHVAATADIGAEIRKGMIALRIVKGVMLNKYKDSGKRAAWRSATHVEKTPVGNPSPKDE